MKIVLYRVSNVIPTILHRAYYTSPSLLTILPPIYTLPIAPRFHPFPTLHWPFYDFHVQPSFKFLSLAHSTGHLILAQEGKCFCEMMSVALRSGDCAGPDISPFPWK